MSQDEALKCLKKNRRWMTTQEVSEKTTMQKHNAAKNLAALYKYKEVERKPIQIKTHCNSWTYSWRIK